MSPPVTTSSSAFPFLVIRLMRGVYAVRQLPTDLHIDVLIALAASARDACDELHMCLALDRDRALYLRPDGSSEWSKRVPRLVEYVLFRPKALDFLPGVGSAPEEAVRPASPPPSVVPPVSGAGTGGKAMWARVKGRTEAALLELFPSACMVRLAMLRPISGEVSKSRWTRIAYAALGPLFPLVQWIAPNAVTSTEELGRAMICIAREGASKLVLEHAYPPPVFPPRCQRARPVRGASERASVSLTRVAPSPAQANCQRAARRHEPGARARALGPADRQGARRSCLLKLRHATPAEAETVASRPA